VVDLQADAVRVLEQDGIVARRVGVVLRPVNDLGADLLQEGEGLVDVLALAGPEADVVQPTRFCTKRLPACSGAGRWTAKPVRPPTQ